MLRDLLKWVVPGLVTVLAGSTLTLAMTSADIAEDVSSESTALVQRAGFDWAELKFSDRDLTLSGTTTDQTYVDAAVRRLSLLPGVRSVTSNVTLAPTQTPYRLEASVQGETIALSGGVPDETTRQVLLARAKPADGSLELRSGMPDRHSWFAGAQFVIDQLHYFDRASITMSGLTVDIDGRARSERDFRDLLIVMRAGPPAGVTLGNVRITPALVSPYRWSASFDGQRLEITGYVPDSAMAERYHTAAVGGLQVATGLALGSGEPDQFADVSQMLVEQLSRLEYGSATIVDGQSTLTGAPPTLEIAQAVTEVAQSAGSIVTLEPPRVDDYWVSVTLQPGGALVFDGYAPDAATRDGLQQRPGADTTYLELGRGAPDRYQSAMDFGLAALARMSEGRFALNKTRLTLTGIARSGDDYLALLDTLAESAPQGFDLAPGTLSAPAAAPYRWSATKDASGATSLTGMVPDPDARAKLLAEADTTAGQGLIYASGEPRNFMTAAQTGIAMLDWLVDGQVVLDGTGWTITGNAGSAIDKAAIEADFAARKLAGAGWSMAIAAPQPAVAAAPEPAPAATTAPSAVEPYLWSATKNPDGAIKLTGVVPSAALKQAAAGRLGSQLTDETTLDPDAPAGFARDAAAAMSVLSNLTDGIASFDGAQWRIDGNLIDADSRARIDTALAAAATPADDWSLTLLAPMPAAVSAPAPEPEPTPQPAPLPAPVAETAPPPAVSPVAPQPTAPAPPAATPTVDPSYAFSATRSADGAMIFSGQAPSEAALDSLLEVADADTAAVSIAAGAPPAFVAGATLGLQALQQLTAGNIDLADGLWRLAGQAPDAATRDAVMAALGTDPATKWSVDVDIPAPVAAPPVVPAPTPATAAKVDISACAGPIDDFSGRNAILFQSGAALIAKESEGALDELVILLQACPDALIHVEGHTDADGDAQLNLGLSVARAEAVVDALVARGINPQRLYAVGYGESTPVADNTTSAGKRQNRRIVVTVSDEHF